MNILSIAYLLPVPGYIKRNNVIFTFYENYCNLYNSEVHFIKLVLNVNQPMALLKSRWKLFYLVKKKKSYKYGNWNVDVLPYFAMGSSTFWLMYLSFLKKQKMLEKIIVQKKIDIVHAQYIFPDGYWAYLIYRRFNIPYVITTRKEQRIFNKPFQSRLAKKILTNSSYITTLNKGMYNKVRSLGFENCKMVGHGVDRSFLDFNTQYGYVEEVKIISIGDLKENNHKNIDRIIIALSKLKANYKFKYTHIGKGEEEENIKIIAREYDLEEVFTHIVSVDYEQIPKVLSEHHIFILPAEKETFGRVFVEAMAVGLPVICARDSGVFGYYKEFESGLTVNPESIDDISNKLELLIQDPMLREKIGRNAKELVRQNMTWDSICKRFHDIYQISTSTGIVN